MLWIGTKKCCYFWCYYGDAFKMCFPLSEVHWQCKRQSGKGVKNFSPHFEHSFKYWNRKDIFVAWKELPQASKNYLHLNSRKSCLWLLWESFSITIFIDVIFKITFCIWAAKNYQAGSFLIAKQHVSGISFVLFLAYLLNLWHLIIHPSLKTIQTTLAINRMIHNWVKVK